MAVAFVSYTQSTIPYARFKALRDFGGESSFNVVGTTY